MSTVSKPDAAIGADLNPWHIRDIIYTKQRFMQLLSKSSQIFLSGFVIEANNSPQKGYDK